jgi:hypothetical protein
MICWTIMSSTNVLCGLLSYLLFISDTNKPLNYLINTILFCILSFLTQERILIIIACEIFYTITNLKVLNDIAYDTICSIKTGLINLFQRSFENVNFISNDRLVTSKKWFDELERLSFDFFIFTGSLGRFFRNSVDDFSRQPLLQKQIFYTRTCRSLQWIHRVPSFLKNILHSSSSIHK